MKATIQPEGIAPKENPIIYESDSTLFLPEGLKPKGAPGWNTVEANIPQEMPIHSTIPEGITPKLSPIYMGAGTSVSSPTGGAPSASLPAWVVPVGLLALAYLLTRKD